MKERVAILTAIKRVVNLQVITVVFLFQGLSLDMALGQDFLDNIFDGLRKKPSDEFFLRKIDSLLECRSGYDTARIWGFAKELLVIAEKNKDQRCLQRCYSFLGTLHFDSDMILASQALHYYHKSYDLAIQLGDSMQLYKTQNFLGYLYGAFGFVYEGEKYMSGSLAINEELAKSDSSLYSKLGRDYIYLGGYHMITKKDSLGDGYFKKAKALPFMDSLVLAKIYYYKGLKHLQQEENVKGLKLMENVLPLLKDKDNSELDNFKDIFIGLGRAYIKNQQYDKADYYLKKTLGIIGAKRDGYSENYIARVYHLMYALNKESNRLNQAIFYKESSDSVFGIVRDKWSKAYIKLDSARILIGEKTKIKKEKEYQSYIDTLKKNKTVLSFGIVVLLVGGVLVYLSLIRSHKQKITGAQNELNQKNKELTTASLKLIEHQGLMLETANKLKELNKPIDEKLAKEIRSLIRSIESRHDDGKHWEQFKAVFEQVNNNFFAELAKKHERLTSHEMKLCALLRLNFENKDIARILGINPDSVHKARHRLRKKLELEKETNLESYFMQI